MRCAVALVLCLVSVVFAQTPRLQIKEEPLPSSTSVPQIRWAAPTTTKIYCMGEPPVKQLGWLCPNCNETIRAEVENRLRQATRDRSSDVNNLPMIELNPMDVTTVTAMNGRTLVCEGSYEDNLGASQVASTSATVTLSYLLSPVIVNSAGQRPVFLAGQNGGFRFYIECSRTQSASGQPTGGCGGAGSVQLRCAVEANPPASVFEWDSDGVRLGSSSQLNVGVDKIGKSITCAASNGRSPTTETRRSESVRIDPLYKPQLVGTNFKDLRSKMRNGVQNIDQSFELQCAFSASPRPDVRFRLQSGVNEVVNVTCREGPNGALMAETRPTTTSPLWSIASKCTVVVSNYSFSGQYWCSGCNSVAENHQECQPDRLPSGQDNSISVDVKGRPMRADERPRVTQNGEAEALLEVYFCADPAPRPPNDVYWKIDDERVDIDQRSNQFLAKRPRQNASFADCYVAPLLISPVTADDQKRKYELFLRNIHGTDNINVRVDEVFGVRNKRAGGGSAWWIILLIIVILIIACIILVVCCYWRRLFCFGSSPRRKPNPPPEKLHSNIAPDSGYRWEPAAPPPRPAAPPMAVTNGYNPEKRTHEGYNYAELDLVQDMERPPPPAAQPTDYVHLQPTLGLKSATNSVV